MLNKLKQFKDLRDQAKQVQNVLAQETVHADAIGGKVNLIMDGNQKIMSIDIDDSLMNVESKAKVTKGIIECVESANKKLQKVMAKKIQSGEMEMPDMSSLLGS